MKRINGTRTESASSRAGVTMVLAMMALLLASLMIAGLLKTVSMSHRQLKRDEFRIQASLLADAGFGRALSLMRSQPDFSDDVWNIPAGQLTSERTAVVRMKLTNDPAQPAKRLISVVAEYPHGHPDVVRITRVIAIR